MAELTQKLQASSSGSKIQHLSFSWESRQTLAHSSLNNGQIGDD
jgi:hypothetical protein